MHFFGTHPAEGPRLVVVVMVGRWRVEGAAGSVGDSRVGFGVLPRNEPRHNLSLGLFAELPPERSGAGSRGAKYHKMRRQTLRGGWAAG